MKSISRQIPIYDLKRTICDLVRSRSAFGFPDRQDFILDFFVHHAFLRFVWFPSSYTYITLNGENSKRYAEYTR